ncbi:RelA/SpoT family protein [Pseudazoarcus pumilus]|uniref:Guanosine-3',5'-bis(Diphosphate) 3'-pyrophosphohydrolase n=1 Tax=Pseudazoarcus pumilus TaxID=2067960 RepID=A0A2I6S302_9RHOO|nr:bifunctional (p)ppGpp synthetase/guanosine-3',5'-bis(diphosphate) 3'-pyrophosphohydrolase [Pseudazoarcus pumilus]AUN93639.1 guanosine-3',5'-bis(diphosphate) 3'-pyrophosphohydrolase [Pseudazoarcus pumilus]
MDIAADVPASPNEPFSPPPSSVLSLDFGRLKTKLETYLKPEDIGLIEAAYHFSADAHQGQFRSSGDPYISHPVAVADIISDWRLDSQALIAALLHDVMEDTHISKQEIAERFGKVSAELVDGLSKLDKVEFRSRKEAQAENFRKMLLAMANDLRVILIKLADRLHNMRTLDHVRPEKRRRIATETLDIYAPIANRLGLNTLYRELQELSFEHKYPLRFQVLSRAVKAARGNRREVVGKVLKALEERLPQWGIAADIFGREKHLFSIYRKMVEKNLSFSQVLDIYGFRVIVPDVPTCYVAIGALHSLYKPVPGKFKDYIAIPKANGYQSLHTTLIGPFGTPIEIQVRTAEMHHIADAGVASHWLYKDDEKTLTELEQRTHNWLQSLLELQHTSAEATEFLEHVKIDLFPGEVYVFTPQGKILSMPRGSTPVDFAYAVHTDIGNRCVACRINTDLMPLRTELHNGDQVEIITAAHANPNPAWLSYVRTGKARAQIRHFLKNAQNEESVALGERLLNQSLRPHGLTLGQISTFAWDRFLKDRGVKSKKDVFSEIGLGKRLPVIVARRLVQAQDQESGRPDVIKPKSISPIHISGAEGIAVQFGSCCQPIPGDPIIGVIRKGRGLEVHRHDCTSVAKIRGDRGRWVDVEWEAAHGRTFDVTLKVITREGRGVLARVASAISEADCNIQNVTMDNEQGVYISLNLTIQARDRMHLASVMRAVRRVPEVMRIGRIRSDGSFGRSM